MELEIPNATVISEEFVTRLGYLFYVVSPNKTSFETLEEVPDYIVQVVPLFVVLVVLEYCVLFYQGKPTQRINDAVGSLSQGVFQELTRIVVRSIQLTTYTYVYNNWRLTTLPWDSPWTWWLCFMGVDFFYYWAHRAMHEINFFWAAHQVHHSSEEYNLTTALRQSIIQYHSVWMMYMPMALAIPPSVFLVHNQFNLLYQFWIHTEVIKTLGPLEYVLNTASHHRVHHGRNRYCIDKNYGGTLIIWDRLFGTFQAEKEEVVYGLTHPINSFEPFYIQFCHLMHMWRTFLETSGFWNKLSVIIKGPGWSPGKPWHGHLEDIPDVKAPVQKYDPPLQTWCMLYVCAHFLVIILGYVETAENKQILPWMVLWGSVAYLVFSLAVLGMLLEGRVYAPWLEIIRCSLFLPMDLYFLPYAKILRIVPDFTWIMRLAARGFFASSAIFWLFFCLKTVTFRMHKPLKEKAQ